MCAGDFVFELGLKFGVEVFFDFFEALRGDGNCVRGLTGRRELVTKRQKVSMCSI